MDYAFLVTTDINDLKNIKSQIVMVDGTVPGWQPREGDLHFDHHRAGGSNIQIDEIDFNIDYNLDDDATFVTTQVDADACVAASYLIGIINFKSHLLGEKDKLSAIAYDCDHLVVPPYLNEYGDFATKVVAAMKSNSDALIVNLQLDTDRKKWSKEDKKRYASAAFEEGVNDLCLAIQCVLPYPGENGEADKYLNKLNSDIKVWQSNGLISKYRNILIFDCTQINGYLDPRVSLRAAANIGAIGEQPYTVTQRKIVNDGEFLGYSYTVGVVPLHDKIAKVDYLENKVFEQLTINELLLNDSHFNVSVENAGLMDVYVKLKSIYEKSLWLCSDKVKLGWGGRKTVGGSSWNTPSKLTPQSIIDVLINN